MTQQTAVEWFYRELKSLHDACYDTNEAVDILYEQAKQMEKEQIITAFDTAYEDEDRIGREYYEETFKTDSHDRKDISKT